MLHRLLFDVQTEVAQKEEVLGWGGGGIFRLIDFEIPEQEVSEPRIDRSCELSHIVRVLLVHTCWPSAPC
jgi:hypothetical protein